MAVLVLVDDDDVDVIEDGDEDVDVVWEDDVGVGKLVK